MRAATRTLTGAEDLDALTAQGAAIVVAGLRGCAASRQVLAAVQRFAGASRTKVAVGVLDVAARRDLAFLLDVTEVPTLLFYLDGRVVMRELVPSGTARLNAELQRARQSWWRYFQPDVPSWPPRAEA